MFYYFQFNKHSIVWGRVYFNYFVRLLWTVVVDISFSITLSLVSLAYRYHEMMIF